jgi:hypothetical protein
MLRLIFVVAAVAACDKKPEPAVSSPPIATGSSVAVAANKPADRSSWIQPAKQLPWQRPTRAASQQETLFAGTWAAKVGDYASRSVVMADKVVLGLGSNKDFTANVVDAIDKDNKVSTNCIWVELRPDFTGFRRECAVVNGEPSALDQNDLMTGAKRDFGTKLEWFVDEQDTNALKIRFADDMLVPAVRDGKLVQLVFRTWVLRLDQPDKAAGANYFKMKESFPEHDYALPTEYSYYIASGSYLK